MSTLVTTNLKNESSASNNIVLNADGTVSLDGAFSGDINFDSGTLYVDATNNRVGVGTSSPSNTLHVNSGTINGVALFESTDVGANITLTDSVGSSTIETTDTQLKIGVDPNNTVANSDLRLQVDGSTKLLINSSGNVGIGTTSPNTILEASTSVNTGGAIRITNPNSGTGANASFVAHNGTFDASFGIGGTNYTTYAAIRPNAAFIYCNQANGIGLTADNANGFINFVTGGSTERARIDSSGRLLVGTSSGQGNSLLQVQGDASSTAAAGVLYLRRGLNTAAIGANVGADLGSIQFGANDGTVAASIQSLSDATWSSTSDTPGRLVFSTTADGASSPTTRMTIPKDGNTSISNSTAFFPITDNAVSLGINGGRWSAVWAANGTIQTSDERAKTDINDAQIGSDFIKSLRPVSYKWIEGGKRDTGERDEDNNYIYESAPGTRTHWGFIAQEVKEAVDAAGVDFGGWVLTDKDDPDSDQALRYDQFIAPLTKALQETMAELEALKAEVAALKAS